MFTFSLVDFKDYSSTRVISFLSYMLQVFLPTFSLFTSFALSFGAWEFYVIMHSNLSIFCLWLLPFILHKVRD